MMMYVFMWHPNNNITPTNNTTPYPNPPFPNFHTNEQPPNLTHPTQTHSPPSQNGFRHHPPTPPHLPPPPLHHPQTPLHHPPLPQTQETPPHPLPQRLQRRQALPRPQPQSQPHPRRRKNVEDQVVEDSTFDKRRLEEKFAVLNTGVYECRSCGYNYDESAGDPSYPVPPGLPFDRLPEDWRCPTCGAARSFFNSKSVEIAGFAQNQQFGLGANTLTSGQKGLLIYGSLAFFFALFLSGYFLQ